jgi:hypothetical protein
VTIVGVHFGSLLPIGAIIKSDQHHARMYRIAHRYYAEVYRELTGRDFPYEFGYAYRYPSVEVDNFRQSLSWIDGAVANFVEAPADTVIRGTPAWSIYHSLEGHSIRGTVAERLANRERHFREWARAYFTKEKADEHEELISPSWVVIGHQYWEKEKHRDCPLPPRFSPSGVLGEVRN